MSTTLSCETCDAQNLSVYFESNDQKKLEYDGVRLSSSLGCQFCSLLKEAAEIVVKLVNSANTKTSAPVRADSIALSPPQNFDQTLNIAVCLDVSKSTKTPGMTVNSYRLQLFTSYGKIRRYMKANSAERLTKSEACTRPGHLSVMSWRLKTLWMLAQLASKSVSGSGPALKTTCCVK